MHRLRREFQPHHAFLLMAWLGMLLLGRTSAASTAVPDVEEILRRFLARAREAAEMEAGQEICYLRTTRVEQLTEDGTVRETRVKEHAVTNRAGVIRARLVRVDSQDPSERELESDRKGDSEARKESGRRRRGPDFLDEALVRRFTYRFEAEEQLEGRRVFRLAYEPRTDAADSTANVDRLLSALHGQIWIDAEQFELVKVESRLRSAIRLLGGLAGALNRLEFAIKRRPIAPGHWANISLTTRVEGRKLFTAFRARVQVDQDAFNVRPVSPAKP